MFFSYLFLPVFVIFLFIVSAKDSLFPLLLFASLLSLSLSVCHSIVCVMCEYVLLSRWLVAMVISSLCSVLLWWIVHSMPPPINNVCINGLGV